MNLNRRAVCAFAPEENVTAVIRISRLMQRLKRYFLPTEHMFLLRFATKVNQSDGDVSCSACGGAFASRVRRPRMRGE